MTDRELDAKIAKHVFGAKTAREVDGCIGQWMWLKDWTVIPHYSTDIARAWEVIEKLTDKMDFQVGNYNPGWWCEITEKRGIFQMAHKVADSASRAICLAALAAVTASS